MKRSRRGTVLLVVVVIVMLLSLAAYKFMLTMETENVAAAINADRVQAKQAAYSARDLLQLMLEQSRQNRDAMGGLQDNPALFAGSPALLAMANGASASTATADTLPPPFGIVAYALPLPIGRDGVQGGLRTDGMNRTALSTGSTVSSGNRPIGDASSSAATQIYPPTRFGAKNESAKLHLLKLLEWEVSMPGAASEALLQLPGMDAETADAILDWIDRDDDPRDNGVESEFYSTLTRPLHPRNAMIRDLDELLFVKGVSQLRLYGTETDKPIVPGLGAGLRGSAFSTSPSNVTPTTVRQSASGTFGDNAEVQPVPWIDLLTVYSGERNESYGGRRRVFLNQENLQELHADLAEVMPLAWANFIVLYRQFGGETSHLNDLSDSRDAPEITIDFSQPAEVQIRSRFDLFNAIVTTSSPESDGEEVQTQSPMHWDLPPAEIVDWFDRTTLYPWPRIVGRVNVNEAPREVLMALPGITEELADGILQARATGTEQSSRHHAIWLLAEGVVEPTTMELLLPHVTCGGDVYRAEVWGRSTRDTPLVRFETVLDATHRRCRPTYYRELDAPMKEIAILTTDELRAAGLISDTPTNSTSDFASPYAR